MLFFCISNDNMTQNTNKNQKKSSFSDKNIYTFITPYNISLENLFMGANVCKVRSLS